MELLGCGDSGASIEYYQKKICPLVEAEDYQAVATLVSIRDPSAVGPDWWGKQLEVLRMMGTAGSKFIAMGRFALSEPNTQGSLVWEDETQRPAVTGSFLNK